MLGSEIPPQFGGRLHGAAAVGKDESELPLFRKEREGSRVGLYLPSQNINLSLHHQRSSCLRAEVKTGQPFLAPSRQKGFFCVQKCKAPERASPEDQLFIPRSLSSEYRVEFPVF